MRERGGENIVDSIMLLPVEWLPLDVRRWDSMLTLLFALRPKSESYGPWLRPQNACVNISRQPKS